MVDTKGCARKRNFGGMIAVDVGLSRILSRFVNCIDYRGLVGIVIIRRNEVKIVVLVVMG